MTPYKPPSAEILKRLRNGETLAQLAHATGLYPEQVYNYLTRRPRHSSVQLLIHRELEAKTLRSIKNKRYSMRQSTRFEAGTFRIATSSNDPYGQQLTGSGASLVDIAEAYTGSSNLSATPELSREWEALEMLTALYCGPIPRKKPNP